MKNNWLIDWYTVVPDIVSVIIPTFNRNHLLQKVLGSYLVQSNLKEVIIVDDGSTDGTYEYLSKNTLTPKIKIIRHENNFGLPMAKNSGISAVTGNYVLFGEDDVYLRKDYISILLECLVKENADIIAGRIIKGDAKLSEPYEEDSVCIADIKGFFLNHFLNQWMMQPNFSTKVDRHILVPFVHAIFLVKAEICKELYFDPLYYIYRDDVDFCARAGKKGYKIIFCPHTSCVHLYHGKGVGGLWKHGVLKNQISYLKNNNMWINRHYEYLKSWGLKGNKFTYQMLHTINRLRLLYLFYRYFKQ